MLLSSVEVYGGTRTNWPGLCTSALARRQVRQRFDLFDVQRFRTPHRVPEIPVPLSGAMIDGRE
jgi:hypothetical protein